MIGSSCVLSGCTIHDEAFLGNSVIVREGAEVGASKIEHGSLVETGTKIPAGQVRKLLLFIDFLAQSKPDYCLVVGRKPCCFCAGLDDRRDH